MVPSLSTTRLLSSGAGTFAYNEIQAIARVSSLLQAALPLDEVLSQLLEALIEGFGVERAELYVVDERARVLVGRHFVHVEGGRAVSSEAPGDRIPLTGYPDIISSAVLMGQTQVIEDVAQGGESLRLNEAMRARVGHGSFAALPLVAWGQVVGVITLSDTRPRRPLQDRLPLLNAFGVQAGLAIERARLSDDRDRALRELTGLLGATAAMQGSQPLGEILQRILEGAVDGLQVERAILFLHDTGRGVLRGEHEVTRVSDQGGSGLARVAGLEIPIGDPDELLSAAVLGRRPFASQKEGGESPLRVHPALRALVGSGEFVAAPLLAGDRVAGLLVVSGFHEPRPIRERLRLLMAYGAQAGLALERALLEKSIRASEQRYREFLELSPDGIVESSLDGKILSCNHGMARMLGYSRQELLGLNARSLYVDPTQRAQLMSMVQEHGHFEGMKVSLWRKDKSVAVVSATSRRRLDPDGPVFESIVRDVTQEHDIERGIRLLSCITMQSQDAIICVDRAGSITAWNQGAWRMFGWNSEEVLGKSWLILATEDCRPAYEGLMATSAGTDAPGPGPWLADTLARRSDGDTLPVRLSVSVLTGNTPADAGWSILLRDLSDEKRLTEQSELLKDELYSRNRLEGIVGDSRAMEQVRDRVRRVARFNSSVLVVGPSGTGKELIANAIHYNSPRRDEPLVKVNCAAIPEDLLESELFGIDRNVATGVDSRVGRFELADGGTLFLDEIGDMSLQTQAKILRVLQEREFSRVGGKKVIKVDVRIVAATNKDLQEEIRHRRFREDLYYRLNVIVITLPPLSARREDIDPLIDHFLSRFSRENGISRKHIPLKVRALLSRYDWPGNVRELEHCVERALVMSEHAEIQEDDLPPGILIWKEAEAGAARGATRGRLSETIRSVEERVVREALDQSGGVQARAARLLGISERSMWYRVKKLGLSTRDH